MSIPPRERSFVTRDDEVQALMKRFCARLRRFVTRDDQVESLMKDTALACADSSPETTWWKLWLYSAAHSGCSCPDSTVRFAIFTIGHALRCVVPLRSWHRTCIARRLLVQAGRGKAFRTATISSKGMSELRRRVDLHG